MPGALAVHGSLRMQRNALVGRSALDRTAARDRVAAWRCQNTVLNAVAGWDRPPVSSVAGVPVVEVQRGQVDSFTRWLLRPRLSGRCGSVQALLNSVGNAPGATAKAQQEQNQARRHISRVRSGSIRCNRRKDRNG